MADVHKSNSDEAELPELEPVDDDSTGDLQSNVESDPGTGRGPSLDELSGIYAALIQRDDDSTAAPADESAVDQEDLDEVEPVEEEPVPSVDVTPLSILEAMLFVGNPENEPLGSKQVATLLRGVSPREIDELIKKLNER